MATYNQMQDGGFNFTAYDPAYAQQFLQTADLGQQRFDKATALLEEQLTRLGETETYRPDLLQDRLGTLTEDINKVVDERYGGDRGAAVNYIIKRLGKERRDPFYGLNREQVRQARMAEQFRLKQPERAIITGGGVGVDISQSGVTPQDLAVQTRLRTIDPEYVKEYFPAAGQFLRDFVAKESRIPGFYEKFSKKGLGALSDKDWNKVLSDDDVRRYMENSTFLVDPNIPDDQKNLTGARERLKDVINSIYGTQIQSQFIKDPLLAKKLAGPTSPGLDFGTERGLNNPQHIDAGSIANPKGLSYSKGLRRNTLIKPITDNLLSKPKYQSLKDFGTVDELLSATKLPYSKYTSGVDGLKRKHTLAFIDNYQGGRQDVVQDDLKDELDRYLHPGVGANERIASQGKITGLLLKHGYMNEDQIKRSASDIKKAYEFRKDFDNQIKDISTKDKTLVGNFRSPDIFTPYSKLNTQTRARLKDIDNFIGRRLDLSDFEFLHSNFPDVDFKKQDELRKNRDSDYEQAREDGRTKFVGAEVLPEVGLVMRVETKNDDGTITDHIIKPTNERVSLNIVNAMNDTSFANQYNNYKVISSGLDFIDNTIPELIKQGALSSEMTFSQMLDTLQADPNLSRYVPYVASAAKHYNISLNTKLH